MRAGRLGGSLAGGVPSPVAAAGPTRRTSRSRWRPALVGFADAGRCGCESGWVERSCCFCFHEPPPVRCCLIEGLGMETRRLGSLLFSGTVVRGSFAGVLALALPDGLLCRVEPGLGALALLVFPLFVSCVCLGPDRGGVSIKLTT